MSEAADWEIIERGSGSDALILIPGAMGTAGVFAAVIALLPPDLRVIAVSPRATPDIEALAAELITLLRERRVTRAKILGTSFGGYLAQFVAAHAPDLVSHLILANTFADPTLGANRRDPAVVAADDAATMRASAVERVRNGPASATRDALLAQLEREAPETLKARALALARGVPVPPLALDIANIVLIDTADDPVIAPAMRAELLARYAGARHVTLPSGGHYPYLADPASYAAVIAGALGHPVPQSGFVAQ